MTTAVAINVNARAQLEAIRDEWLQPLVETIAALRRRAETAEAETAEAERDRRRGEEAGAAGLVRRRIDQERESREGMQDAQDGSGARGETSPRASGGGCGGCSAGAGGAVILRSIERIYAPLGDHLATCGVAGERRVTLGFAALETVLGRPLPATARESRRHRQWWLDGAYRPHAWYGWLRAGWRVEAVDLAAETVTFARAGGAA